MNFLNRLVPSLASPSDASSSSSSSSSASSAIPAASATPSPSLPLVDVVSSADCAVCSSPCSVHPSYPSHLKIESGSMAGSVKRHRRHVLCAQGRSYSRWPEEVTSEADAYVSLLSALLREAEDRLGYAVRVSETDVAPAESEQGPERADLYVFPDMLHFPAVSRDALPQWVDELLLRDKGLMRFRHPHATAADRRQQALQAAGRSEEGASSESADAQPDVDFECRPVTGCALLICAHKLRDKRCGVTGPILAKQIHAESEERREAEERRADMEAQQRIRDGAPPLPASLPGSQLLSVRTMLISHIGGHKYAGNVIAYPAGVWYGRVTPCHVHLLLDAHATQAQPENEATKVRIADSRHKLEELKRGEVELEW